MNIKLSSLELTRVIRALERDAIAHDKRFRLDQRYTLDPIRARRMRELALRLKTEGKP